VYIVETVREMETVRESSIGPVAMMATLGGMHAGHEALLTRAREVSATLVASLFLNPTQFNDASDLDRYPTDRERDLEIFRSHGVDVVFMPSVDEMYPPGSEELVDAGPVGSVLEGAHRPGHFAGVATVVAKLLDVIRPDIAVWGAKDAQQNVVIRRISSELGPKVDHRIIPTVRDEDGLALSSRNARLTPEGRAAAPVLWRALAGAQRRFQEGETSVHALLAGIRETVASQDLVSLEYASVSHPETLEDVRQAEDGSLVSLAAAIDHTRLIDNVVLGRRG